MMVDAGLLEKMRIENQIRAGNAMVSCLRAAAEIAKTNPNITRDDFLGRAAQAYDEGR